MEYSLRQDCATLHGLQHHREDVEEESLPKQEPWEDKVAAPQLQTYCDAATSSGELYTPAATGREK